MSNITTAVVDDTAPERDEDTWVLVPVLDEPGQFWCLFPDGSYAAWVPDPELVC